MVVGASAIEASAAFQIDSTTGGALFPRMTTTQRDAIASPATGLKIFNTTTGQFEFYNGAAWLGLSTLNASGFITHEQGGLEADVSAYGGVPLINGGATSEIKYNLTATAAPTVDNDTTEGYVVSSRWYDVTNDKEYVCLDNTDGAAVWIETTQSGSVGATPDYGSVATVTLSSDVCAAGSNRHVVVAAQTGTADDLIEVTGLSVGEKIALRADAGDTITVKHNSGSATIKILIQDDADFVLDEKHPLELMLISATELVQIYDEASGGGGGGAPTSAEYFVSAADGTLSAENVISGLAGDSRIHGVGGGGIDAEYDSTSHGLTASSTPDTLDSDTTRPSHLFIKTVDTTEYLLTRSFSPAGAFDVRIHASMMTDATSANGSFGIHIGNSGNTSRLLLQFQWSGTALQLACYTYSGSYSAVGTARTIYVHDCYMRITRDGSNNIVWYWSMNGYDEQWQRLASTSFTFTPANVGYRQNAASAVDLYCTSDFLRTDVS